MSSKLILAGSGYPSFFMNSKMVIFNILAFFLSLIALPNIIINCLNYLSILKDIDGNYNMLTFCKMNIMNIPFMGILKYK